MDRYLEYTSERAIVPPIDHLFVDDLFSTPPQMDTPPTARHQDTPAHIPVQRPTTSASAQRFTVREVYPQGDGNCLDR